MIVQNPTAYRSSLINNACTLGDRLKYYDLVDDPDETLNYGNESLSSRPDKTWLKDLRTIQSDYNVSLWTSFLMPCNSIDDPFMFQQLISFFYKINWFKESEHLKMCNLMKPILSSDGIISLKNNLLSGLLNILHHPVFHSSIDRYIFPKRNLKFEKVNSSNDD